MFIRSERLFLRPGWPEDSADLRAMLAEDQLVRGLAHMPWLDAGLAGAAADHALPCFLVTLPGRGGARIIGAAGLARREGNVRLGYWIERAHRGHGYATEAVRAVLNVARGLGHERLVSSRPLDIPAAGRVLEKAGFRRAGLKADRQSGAVQCPAREYEIVFAAPGNCDGDDDMGRRRAA